MGGVYQDDLVETVAARSAGAPPSGTLEPCFTNYIASHVVECDDRWIMDLVPRDNNMDHPADMTAWPRQPLEGSRVTFGGEETLGRGGSAALPRQYGRRLSDKILVAFHHACDLNDFEVAEELLRVLEIILMRKPTTQHAGRRRSMESLVAAHERLWQLRHPDAIG